MVNVEFTSTGKSYFPPGCFISLLVNFSHCYPIILLDITLSVKLYLENATLNIKLLKKPDEMLKPGQNELVLILFL